MSIGSRFIFIFVTLIHHSAASFCGGNRKHDTKLTNTTEFQHNLKIVLDQLPTNKANISLYRWVGVYSGIDPNAAFAQARCIGYLDNYTCHDCIQKATTMLKKDDCVEATSSTLYYGDYDCMAQFSNRNLIGNMEISDNFIAIKKNSSNVEPSSAIFFNEARNKLFDKLSENARARLDGYQMFAAGKWYEYMSKKTIYGATQCSSNLNSEQCNTCLNKVIQQIAKDFDGKIGGSIVGPSCDFRYEVYPFLSNTLLFVDFSPLSPPFPQVLPPPSTGELSNKILPVIYIIVPLVINSIIC